MNSRNFAGARRQLWRGLALMLISLAAACSGGHDGPTGPGDPGNVPGQNPGTDPGSDPGTDPGTEDPGTPGGAGVPNEVLGTWYAGDVSSINFFEPNTGHWGNAGGTGLFYTLKADGTFEYGFELYSQLYDCWTQVMVYRRGTVDVSADGSTLLLHTSYAKMHSEDNCNESGNYDKSIPLEEETLLYQPGEDDYGNAVLYLWNPGVDPTPFHPQDWSE